MSVSGDNSVRGELATLRSLFVAFATALALFAFVLVFINPFAQSGSSALACVAVVVVYAMIVLAIAPRIEKPLPCDADAIAGAFRTRFFSRIAFGESIALLAFVLCFLVRANLVYFVGALLGLLAMWRATPTQAALQREQVEMANRGCGVDLVAALGGPPYTR